MGPYPRFSLGYHERVVTTCGAWKEPKRESDDFNSRITDEVLLGLTDFHIHADQDKKAKLNR